MKVSVQYAAEHFEDLVSAVYSGEAVEISAAGRPALHLVRSSLSEPRPTGVKRVLGAGKALAFVPSEAELQQIDGEWKERMERKSIAGSKA